jgi:hypothetical protein
LKVIRKCLLVYIEDQFNIVNTKQRANIYNINTGLALVKLKNM